MARTTPKSAGRQLEKLMAEKSLTLSKAQSFETMDMPGIAQPLWVSAAAFEERIASLLDAQGQTLEASIHRISAASCHQKAGDPSRATNLYRAALAGPLRDGTRKEVEAMLAQCHELLTKG
jgi:hypothetical protein